MGKRSKRSGRADRDVHAVIREQAEWVKRSMRSRPLWRHGIPNELDALCTAACEAVEFAVPPSIEFEGRRYFLRVSLAMKLELFDSPSNIDPLICVVTSSIERFGHAPGH